MTEYDPEEEMMEEGTQGAASSDNEESDGDENYLDGFGEGYEEDEDGTYEEGVEKEEDDVGMDYLS